LKTVNANGPAPPQHQRKRKGANKKPDEPKPVNEPIQEKTLPVPVTKSEAPEEAPVPVTVEPEVVLGEGNWMDLVDEEKDNVDPLAGREEDKKFSGPAKKDEKVKKPSKKELRDAKKRAMAPVPETKEAEIVTEAKEGEMVTEVKEGDAPEKPIEEYWMDPMEAFHVESRFRCPIIAILGHVDTGKTKLLDKIRNTNVQNGEAGGITQQIGASFFPQYKLKEEVRKVPHLGIEVEVPGLLIIDTPGHESFSNLRSRGSSLCDFAILVVDIMHGLENQTLESIQLLQARNTPFVIALNKIDRLKDWSEKPNTSSYKSLESQGGFTKGVFRDNWAPINTQLAMQDINAAMYWENDNQEEYTSIVPTSAITGEGICDILGYIIKYTQETLTEKITKNTTDLKATCLEVKKIEGLGSTIDIILVNGKLSEGDKIVTAGMNGAITTTIRALLTPHPLKEMRVKAEYIHHKTCTGAMGVKIMGPGLETAIAGAAVYIYDTEEELEGYREELKADIKRVRKTVKLVSEGVCVAASTLGSLEALLVFLKTQKVPVAEVCIGDVSKEDCIRALTPLLSDENKKKKREFATVLAFDVKILPEAQRFSDENGIKIITANIIYHLTDRFTEHVKDIKLKAKIEEGKDAIFPCELKIVAVFNSKSPLIMGIEVEAGVLKIGTPVCIVERNVIFS
jgi:translation initiation factor 5B